MIATSIPVCYICGKKIQEYKHTFNAIPMLYELCAKCGRKVFAYIESSKRDAEEKEIKGKQNK